MELRQLEYFVAVARHRHFGRAAEAAYVTQPALSQQVRRLEAELGLALLRRTSRGVELTPAGEDLLVRRRDDPRRGRRARGAMDEHAGVVRGAVRVAATTADALRLPEVLAAFHRDHPGVRVALRHASSARCSRCCAAAPSTSACWRSAPRPPTACDVTALAEEPLRAISAPDEPFGAVAVAVEDLRGRPFVLARAGHALRDAVMDACQDHGFSPVPLLEVGDPATVRFLVNAGLGVSLVPHRGSSAPGPPCRSPRSIEPAPRHALSLLAAGELPPAGRVLAERATGRPRARRRGVTCAARRRA